MNLLDIIFLVIMAFSLVWGIYRGLIREIFGLFFLGLAVYTAYLFNQPLAAQLPRFSNPHIGRFLAFLLIFLVIILLGVLITFFIHKIATIGPLKGIDRLLGGLFGLLRGVVISMVLVYIMIVYPVQDYLLTNSTLTPTLLVIIDHTLRVFPADLRTRIESIKTHDKQENRRIDRTI